MPKNKPTSRQTGRSAHANFSGQHLIRDKSLVRRMIELARLSPEPLVLDIGAGAGALTIPLAQEGWRVLAIENDPLFARKLRGKLGEAEGIRLAEADFLEMPLPRKPFGVVANIPFAITTAVLGRLMDHPAVPFRHGVLIIELGAARRFTADPVTQARILGWRMQFDLKLAEPVPPDRFSPPPRVQCAILTVRRKKEPLVRPSDHARFMGLVTQALRVPAAPLYGALGPWFTPAQLKHLVKLLRVDRSVPVGVLNERQWADVFETMIRYVEPYRWPKACGSSRR
ncbi:rRNA adenine N(6)-methyltransferase family protein [Paenibacillus ehimensis]|uniref:ribosomal RNA small subunit methyltransferase A n=1 Tax=Paenibacillus ehimensis TaxID=79264 RepID=UPI002DB7046D|nr:rRNA adenine N(6)-methyltransferase family protein [Paenibacillus ehimensis]MEC0210502.1 rRNA adenine N(6)-methyltransferase family protein [Paenibacillus ehimensis]